MWDTNTSKNTDFPVTVYPTFNLYGKDATAEIRFEKKDIPVLYEALRIPDIFKRQQGSVCDGMTGLCIALKRLTYPCRLNSDMIPTYLWCFCPRIVHDLQNCNQLYFQ